MQFAKKRQLETRNSKLETLTPLLLFAALLGLYLATLAPTVTARHGGVDGGELATAALRAQVPHPPGYPTYLILARLALQIPAGEPAWRLGLLSACSAASAATLLYLSVLALARAGHSRGGATNSAAPPAAIAPAALCAGLLLGLDSLLWSQAIIVEVYAPALLALAALLWLAVRWWRPNEEIALERPAATVGGAGWGWREQHARDVLRTPRRRGALVAFGLLLGLGYGLHPTLLAALPATALALLAGRRMPRAGELALAGGAALAGLASYALLPLLSQRNGGWGDLSTVSGFFDHVLAREYQALLGAPGWSERLGRLSAALAGLLESQGPWGLALGCWSLAALSRRRPALYAWTGTLAALSLGWAALYGGEHSEVALLPLHLCWACWAGLGLADLLGRMPSSGRAPALRRLLPLVALLPLLLLPWRLPALSLRGAVEDRELALQRLAALPPDAALLTASDQETFPLWYAQAALGARPDVAVVDLRLWQRDWYRRRLEAGGQLTPEDWAGKARRPLYATSSAATALPGQWSGAAGLWRYAP